MSKCPDAIDAEAALLPVMQAVAPKVSLNFTYIASYRLLDPSLYTFSDVLDRHVNSSDASELTCKHGPTECIGNKQQLWYNPSSCSRINTQFPKIPSSKDPKVHLVFE